jgi:hypothetical protein
MTGSPNTARGTPRAPAHSSEQPPTLCPGRPRRRPHRHVRLLVGLLASLTLALAVTLPAWALASPSADGPAVAASTCPR